MPESSYPPRLLQPAEIDQFCKLGYLHLPGALSPEMAEQCAREMLVYMGVDEHDPETFRARRAAPGNRGEAPPGEAEKTYLYSTHAPRLWQAMCDLLGGPDRIIPDKSFRSNGVYSLPDPDVLAAPDPAAHWQAPDPHLGHGGWHVDGHSSWFRHYLDSRQVALLVLILFRDASRLGGATWFAPESPRLLSQYYRENPVGVVPDRDLILGRCRDFRVAEGRAGDAFLLHPFMMHSGSPNVTPRPRLMENDNISLREHLRFDRPDPADFSVLERSILGHLGVDRLTFLRQGPD